MEKFYSKWKTSKPVHLATDVLYFVLSAILVYLFIQVLFDQKVTETEI